MRYIEPKFEIDAKGRVLCKQHSNYDFFSKSHHTYQEERFIERELTCKTCIHYHQNDCYFPRSQINLIEIDRNQSKLFKCKLCGNKIDRMLTVIHKLYVKEKYNIQLPLICCSCYELLKRNSFVKESEAEKKKILFSIFISIIFIGVSLIFYRLSFLSIFIIITETIIIINYLRKRNSIEKGIEYYREHFS